MKALLLVVAVLVTMPLPAAPIGKAERASLTYVARYLAINDVQPLFEQLAADAPMRELPVADAKNELLARVGPATGATWSLRSVAAGGSGMANVAYHVNYPSGYDDGLLFRMKEADGVWRIYDVTSLAEPIPAVRPSATVSGGRGRVSLDQTLAQRTAHPRGWGWLGLAAAALFVVGVFARRVSNAASVAFFAGAILTAVFAGVVRVAPQAAGRWVPSPWKESFRGLVAPRGMTELRALVPLRIALARDRKDTLPAVLSPEAREVAALWLMRAGYDVTDPSIERLKFADRTVTADLVKAEQALAKSKGAEARTAYAAAVTRAPWRDDVLFEAVQLSEDSSKYLQRLHDFGTRDASSFYTLAASTFEEHPVEARQMLETAWSMRPVPREMLVRDERLFATLHDGHLMRVTSLFESAEPAVRPLDLAREPLEWPGAARAYVSGEFLKIEIGDASIEIDEGAPLAPSSAQIVSATHWQERDERKALDDVTTLVAMKDPPNTPIVRERFERSASALASHRRWNDLLRLTTSVSPSSASVSRQLLLHRCVALTHANQPDDARALLRGLAVAQWIADRDDPFTVLALGDLASRLGEVELARKMYESAGNDKDLKDVVTQRLEALELRRKLNESALSLSTANFDIRYDPRMNAAVASRVGDLLEAELVRLRTRFPAQAFQRTTVAVLYWQDFSGGITGSDHILGLYDGEIIVPFAEVERFKTEVVAILTHELTHAIVAQQTGDNAPRWFQEGIARRMELVPVQANVFKNRLTSEIIPLSLLDAIMENTLNPLAISDGYATAQTFMRFLEDRYGPRALETMLRQFAAGNNGEDALTALTGKPLPAIDAEFREWGRVRTNDFTDATPWPYLHLYSPEVDPRIRAGFTFKNRH